jgi:hypothetical protein
MAEVRDIEKHENPPADTDHVLIEKSGDRFIANGSAAGKIDVTFFKPPPFDTEEAATRASLDWAEANNVPVVYVRGIRAA